MINVNKIQRPRHPIAQGDLEPKKAAERGPNLMVRSSIRPQETYETTRPAERNTRRHRHENAINPMGRNKTRRDRAVPTRVGGIAMDQRNYVPKNYKARVMTGLI